MKNLSPFGRAVLAAAGRQSIKALAAAAQVSRTCRANLVETGREPGFSERTLERARDDLKKLGKIRRWVIEHQTV